MALVVGVDGSVSCLDAVRVAVLQGSRTWTSVRLVHAFAWPPLGSSLLGAALLAPAVLGTAESELRREARTMLAGAEAMARQTDPAVAVERRLVTGRPAQVLIGQAGAGPGGDVGADSDPAQRDRPAARGRSGRAASAGLRALSGADRAGSAGVTSSRRLGRSASGPPEFGTGQGFCSAR